jgi:hypothetical protein
MTTRLTTASDSPPAAAGADRVGVERAVARVGVERPLAAARVVGVERAAGGGVERATAAAAVAAAGEGVERAACRFGGIAS